MARRKEPVVEAKPASPWSCGFCFFYDPQDLEKGYCMGQPPLPVVDDAGDVFGANAPTYADRKGCCHWRARHNA